MLISVETAWIVGVLLAATRIGALLAMSPLFSLTKMPVRIGVLLTLVFAAGVTNVVQQYGALDIATLDRLAIALACEFAVGALMAFGINCAFAAFSFGGRILDLQMGFGVANIINPSSNEQAPLMGTLLVAVAALTFFLLNGHHWIARSIVQSYEWFPLGAPLRAISLEAIAQQFGLMFSLGLVLVSPLVAALLLLDVAMAIAARTMPQMNVFMLSMPIKIAAGLTLLAVSAPLLKSITQRIFESIFTYWNAMA